jgi:hypothetical protein
MGKTTGGTPGAFPLIQYDQIGSRSAWERWPWEMDEAELDDLLNDPTIAPLDFDAPLDLDGPDNSDEEKPKAFICRPLAGEDVQAARYRLERQCTEYAYQFLGELRAADRHTRHGKPILPIMYEDAPERPGLGGCVDHDDRGKACIYIMLPRDKRRMILSEGLKETIRHEIIHYYLFVYYYGRDGDDHPLFWALCHIFDAGAYKPIEIPARMKAFNKFLADYNPKNTPSTNLWYAYHHCAHLAGEIDLPDAAHEKDL